RRQRHRRAGPGAEVGVRIQRRAGRGVALRRALVEQREPALDRRRVELLLLALLGLELLPLLFLLLRLRLLFRFLLLLRFFLLGFLFLLRLVALERLGDRIGLRWRGLRLWRRRLGLRLLRRLRLGLGLGFGRRRRLVGGRLDLRLLRDLRGRVLDGLRIADLLDERSRRRGRRRGPHAPHHVSEIVLRDRIDRDRLDLRRQRLGERDHAPH